VGREDRVRAERRRTLTVLTTGLLLLPTHPADRLAAIAQSAERLGYDYLWLADERFFREVYASLTLCALRTDRIALGPCVTDPYSRHPALTAMAIATLDEISGGRAVLGMGAGVSGFCELGIHRARSGVAIREAVELIRRLLTGETVTYTGSTVRFDGGRLDFAPVRADIPVFIASQHSVGCRAAGRVADGAIMQGCVAEPLLAFFRDTVAEGARVAGRDPRAIGLVARINVCIDDDRRAARFLMKPTIVRSLAAQRPEYFTFKTAGLTVPPALAKRLEGLAYTHDPTPLREAAAEVPDEFVDAVTLAGTPDEVAAGVIRLGRSGIAQFMLYPMAPDGRIERTIERFQREVMPIVRGAGL
jgi:5,10-methylenetetrahydromethanopterin reductase